MELYDEKAREATVVDEVSVDELMKHTTYIAEADRLSGSEGEARAVAYFKDVMTRLGYRVNIRQIENFISLPIRASLNVIAPEEKNLSCITQSFSGSTAPEGMEAELVYAAKGENPPVEGKIVVREGLAAPLPAWETEQKGAAGQIWISSGDLPRNMCIATIWGHPTPATAHRIPKTPVITVAGKEGRYLKSLCAAGRVRVRVAAEVWTGFKKVPLAVADIAGVREPEKYILFNGHIDSWHRGASDNATANACMLETARIIAKHRKALRRGVRFAWWSGHSHGRYSGSNWYADYNWQDLYRNAVVHLNVDSLGCRGATEYPDVESMAECYDLGKAVIEKYTGQSPRYSRIGRSGDNSFWGIGLPTLFQLLSRQPKSTGGSDSLIPGLAGFWHTEADTVDKIDPDILLKDTRVYMAALWRLCTAPVLPFSFTATAEEFITLLGELQEEAKGAFDLGPALKEAQALKEKTEKLLGACRKVTGKLLHADAADADDAAAKALDAAMMKLCRILIPVSFSAVDRFDADLAVPIPPFPRLRPAIELATMDPEENAFKFLERQMVRERTRVCHALSEATALIDEALKDLEEV